MGINDQFTEAIERAKELPHQSNERLLELYSLFKQATQGDVTGESPGFFDLKGAAKFDAWEARRGMSKEEAMQAYVDLVNRLSAG